VADSLGISRGRYASWEEGNCEPCLAHLIALRKLHGVQSIDVIIGVAAGEANEVDPLRLAYSRLSLEDRETVDFLINRKTARLCS
jgi:transcriptional regulator with XRE-family HTH domain